MHDIDWSSINNTGPICHLIQYGNFALSGLVALNYSKKIHSNVE